MAGSASASVSTGQRPDDRGRIPGYAGKTGGRGAPGNQCIRDRLLSHLTSRFKDKEDRTCEKIPENGAWHFEKKRRLEFAV